MKCKELYKINLPLEHLFNYIVFGFSLNILHTQNETNSLYFHIQLQIFYFFDIHSSKLINEYKINPKNRKIKAKMY